MDHEDETSAGNTAHQNLNDLHNYLSTFNKEIEPEDDVLSTMGVDAGVGDVGDLYSASGGHPLQEPGEAAVAAPFSSGFYTEQGILDNPLSDETGQAMTGLESGPDRDGEGEEDMTSDIKQEVGAMDLESVHSNMEGFGEDVHMTANISGLQNQGLIMTSLSDSLDGGSGKVIRIVSLGEEGQYLTLGDGSQMQIVSQDLALDSTAPSDTSFVIQEPDIASATTTSSRARSILSSPANSHLGLTGKSATSLLSQNPGGSSSSSTAGNSQVTGVTQLVALHHPTAAGDAISQHQLMALSQSAAITPDSLQQYGVLSADGDGLTGDLGYQTITVLPTELNQEGMNYVLVMAPQEGDKQPVTQLVDLKQESQEFTEELVEVNGEVKRVLHMVPKKFSAAATSAGVNTGAQLMCDYCGYTSSKRYQLTRHMKSHSDERPYKCSECHRGFKTPASLINHVNTHTGTRPHKCKTCDAAFTTSGELVRHIRYRHTFEKPHRCPSCDYASVELSKLKRHMRSHTGERPYKCPHCHYASPDTYKLKRHLRIHTGEKPYECDVCQARFTQSNSLKAHKLIHSGNKPVFQCNLCPTTCGRKTDLKIHFNKLHSVGSPLECKKCGQILADRYSFKQHMRTHDMDKCFKCDQCDFIANTERSLDQHAAIHSNGKKHECSLCHMTFNLKQTLDKHKLTCTLDSSSSNTDKEGSVKNPMDYSLVKKEGSSSPLLSAGQADSGKAVSEPGQDVLSAGPSTSDTLHKNLLQDIKAGKLGDVPQVVIVHPDGTLEEIPSASGDKVNLDDIFSALSSTEKQEKADEAGAKGTQKDNLLPGHSEGKEGQPQDAHKAGDVVETAQCEASTQAEIESDSDSVDESKSSDCVTSKNLKDFKKTALKVQETERLELSVHDGSKLDIDGNSKQEEKPKVPPAKGVTLRTGSASSSSTASTFSLLSMPSAVTASETGPKTELSSKPSDSDNNVSKENSTTLVGTSETSAASSSTTTSNSVPQYVVVKGYTCMSEDGNTVQPTLVNVAVEKDSLVKMFASLGSSGEAGMGLQLLSGELPLVDANEMEGGEGTPQASIISLSGLPLHDMAGLTGLCDAETGDPSLSRLTEPETLSSRDADLSEFCDMGTVQPEGAEAVTSKDYSLGFELEDSSPVHSGDSDLNSSNGENSTARTKLSKPGELNVENDDLAAGNHQDYTSGLVAAKSEVIKDQSGSVNKPVKAEDETLHTVSVSALSEFSVPSSKLVGNKDKPSPSPTSKTNVSKLEKGGMMMSSAPEEKLSLTDGDMCEPVNVKSEEEILVDVDVPSCFHMSEERSESIQPTFPHTPLGNLFTDTLTEETSDPMPDSATLSANKQESLGQEASVATEHSGDSKTTRALENSDAETPSSQPVKQKGSTKRKASTSSAVDSNLVIRGKRVRKALVKVSM